MLALDYSVFIISFVKQISKGVLYLQTKLALDYPVSVTPSVKQIWGRYVSFQMYILLWLLLLLGNW